MCYVRRSTFLHVFLNVITSFRQKAYQVPAISAMSSHLSVLALVALCLVCAEDWLVEGEEKTLLTLLVVSLQKHKIRNYVFMCS